MPGLKWAFPQAGENWDSCKVIPKSLKPNPNCIHYKGILWFFYLKVKVVLSVSIYI